jgi:hypothetical protein
METSEKCIKCNREMAEEPHKKKSCYTLEILKRAAVNDMSMDKNMVEKMSMDELLDSITEYMEREHNAKIGSWRYYSEELAYYYNSTHLPKNIWPKDQYALSNLQIFKIMKKYEKACGNHRNFFKYMLNWNLDISITNEKKLVIAMKKSKGYHFRGFLISMMGEKLRFANHWCAVLVVDNNKIFLFESSGQLDGRTYMLPFIDSLKRILEKHEGGKNIELVYNIKTLQYDFWYCGLFSLYFMVWMILSDKDVLPERNFSDFVKFMRDKIKKLGYRKYFNYIFKLKDKFFINNLVESPIDLLK